jgi:hypothetical protein
MSATTSRVSLYKPAGGENVNVTTDINNNMDKIDTNLNFRVVANATARNAISPFWAGLNVRETDTGKLYVSNGSAPISASWQEIVQTNVRTTDELLLGNLTRQQRTNASDSAWETKAAADANARWFMRADGQMWWGPGNATQDTNLYRSAANTLKTDDSFVAAGDVTALSGKVNLGSAGSISNALSSAPGPVANTTTETVIATFNIPANDMVVGATYELTAWGVASTTLTPTLTFRGRIGGVAGTSNGSTPITAGSSVSNKVWRVTFRVVCITTGASGTFHGNLETAEGVSNTAINPSTVTVRMDGNSVVAVDTTASKDMVITAAWGTANASNTLTCRGYFAHRIA